MVVHLYDGLNGSFMDRLSALTFFLVLTTAVVQGCGRQPDPAPVESIQDILKETENAINQIKDEILETAENIKNE